jgi:hypothetical protein|tara:strand:- start:957 stop:2573 length:1617 start_codon:yes stop_codon:yes gene_type:complete
MSDINNISQLLDGNNPHKQLLEQTRQLVDKWEPTGLLEGIDAETKRSGMAVLLENQANQLVTEASSVGTAANNEQWSGVALPLVRRIFGELAAQDFVSVQPMNLPSGLIFYLDFRYGTDQSNFDANDNVHGVTSASGDATEGLYGAGKFGYSINDTSVTINTGSYSTASVSFADVDFEPSLSSSLTNLRKVTVAKSVFSGGDFDGIRAFEISGSAGSELDAAYPAYTKTSGANLVFVVDPATPTGANAFGNKSVELVFKYHKAPTDTTRGDFEATASGTGAESDAGIPEIDIALRSIAIVAKTRKLKAVWTPELAQDLNAYHSVDAEAELTSLLSEYISMEIDLEILDMLLAGATAKTERWSAFVGREYESSSTSFKNTATNASAYTKGEWFQTLGNKIQSVSNAIHQKTLRGGANFIVISPETATILESIPGYATTSDGAVDSSYAMGVQKVGLLNNRFNVYKNPYMQENQILCGFRGSNFLETGAVYSPYVPLIMTPLVYDPTNFTPRKGVMTRYAKKMVRSEFYGKVIVADVDKV